MPRVKKKCLVLMVNTSDRPVITVCGFCCEDRIGFLHPMFTVRSRTVI